MNVKAGMTVPEGYPYSGFVVTSVARNGWCRGYYPSNVRHGSIEEASTSVRAHWLLGVKAAYNIIPSSR